MQPAFLYVCLAGTALLVVSFCFHLFLSVVLPHGQAECVRVFVYVCALLFVVCFLFFVVFFVLLLFVRLFVVGFTPVRDGTGVSLWFAYMA